MTEMADAKPDRHNPIIAEWSASGRRRESRPSANDHPKKQVVTLAKIPFFRVIDQMRHLCDLRCLLAKQMLSQLSYTPTVTA
jgi:hypothetical protein